MSGPPPPPPPPKLPKVSLPPPKQTQAGGFTDLLKSTRQEEPAIIPKRPPTPQEFEDVLNENEIIVESMLPMELFNWLQFGSQLLVIDIRSKESFEEDHIRSAVSVDWKSFQDQGCEDMLQVEKSVHKRFFYRRSFNVVVYDSDSQFKNPAPILKSFLDALVAEKRIFKSLVVLDGGLASFKRQYGFLTTNDERFSDCEYPSEVDPGFMFLGSWETASNRQALKNLGITHIVNASDVCDMPFKDDFQYIQCALDDHHTADLAQFFPRFLEFVNTCKQENGKVLVHCRMGMSRSPALAILWFMETLNVSLKKATDFVRQHRKFINPNPGFLQQLGFYEEKKYGETTIRFPDEPMCISIGYEWKQDDGSWLKRETVGFTSLD